MPMWKACSDAASAAAVTACACRGGSPWTDGLPSASCLASATAAWPRGPSGTPLRCELRVDTNEAATAAPDGGRAEQTRDTGDRVVDA